MSSGAQSTHRAILVVETDDGTYVRRIPDPAPLISGVDQGLAAEEATRSAVAQWGLPDFIFRPVRRRQGSGNRELGDGVIVVGGRAVVVQVKSRNTDAVASESRERSWIDKAIDKATRQGEGTVRGLRSRPTEMVNLRDRGIVLDASDYKWLCVVIVDHSNPPDNYIASPPASNVPTLALLRADWEFLFEQLRSTNAVLEYLERIADADPIAFGDEPVRYYELAEADATAKPIVMDPALLAGGEHVSFPLLPREPAGHDDQRAHLILRLLMDDISLASSNEITEADRLLVLAEIDALPVGHRSGLGRLLLTNVREVSKTLDGYSWRFHWVRRPHGSYPQLMFGACSRYSSLIQEAFKQRLILGHCDFGMLRGSMEDLVSVGVLLTPRGDGARPWDTTLIRVSGSFEYTAEELENLRRLWVTK